MNILIVDDDATSLETAGRHTGNGRVQGFTAADGLRRSQHWSVKKWTLSFGHPHAANGRISFVPRSSHQSAPPPFAVPHYTSTYTSPATRRCAGLGADQFQRKPCPAKVIVEFLARSHASLRAEPKVIQLPQELNLMKEYTTASVAQARRKGTSNWWSMYGSRRRRRTITSKHQQTPAACDRLQPGCALHPCVDGETISGIAWMSDNIAEMLGYSVEETKGTIGGRAMSTPMNCRP